MKIMNTWAILLSIVAISVQLCAVQPGQEAQKPSLDHIKQEIAVLDQLSVAINNVVTASNNQTRSSVRKEVNKLLHKLDKKVQDELSDDMKIILKSADNNAIKDACKRVLGKIEALKADAAVVQTTQEATIAVNAVSDELKPIVIEEQKEKIIAADEKAKKQGYLSRLKARVFGEEVSWAKVGFYAAVGVATISGLYYGYQHAEDIKKWFSGEKEKTGVEQPQEIEKNSNVELLTESEKNDPIIKEIEKDLLTVKKDFLNYYNAIKNVENNPESLVKKLEARKAYGPFISAISSLDMKYGNLTPEQRELYTKVALKKVKEWGVQPDVARLQNSKVPMMNAAEKMRYYYGDDTNEAFKIINRFEDFAPSLKRISQEVRDAKRAYQENPTENNDEAWNAAFYNLQGLLADIYGGRDLHYLTLEEKEAVQSELNRRLNSWGVSQDDIAFGVSK